MSWSEGQAKDFVKAAKKAMDNAWSNPLFSDEMRSMLLAREFTRVITNQGVDVIKTADLDKLWADMNRIAGLE